jgi:NADH-quinone oxidoreductase subunit L
MVARSHALYVLAPFTLGIIAIIGIATALLAASIAIYQNDIKKVLAYSTVSQLGYMFVGLGVGAFTGAMFHLTTHAFFKALLFLAAGSIIHAMGGEQDLRKMGGLRKALPITFLVFLAGTIAISGIPPFSGFFSKDEILLHAYEQNKLIWALGVFGSMLTAFYMFRLFFLTFSKTFRGTEEQKHHLHESPKSMTIPLIILAVLSVIGGLINVPHIFGGNASLQEFLSPVFGTHAESTATVISPSSELLLMCITVVGALIMILFAWYRFVKTSAVSVPDDAHRNFIVRLLYKKYYLDELYNTIIVKPRGWLSVQFHNADRILIDGFVNSTGSFTLWIGSRIQLLQTGSIGFYLFAMVLGIIIFIFYAFLI